MHRYADRVGLPVCIFTCVACAVETGDTTPSPVASGPGCAQIELAPPEDGVQFEMSLPVPAEREVQHCQLVMLDRDLNVHGSEGYYTLGSHHGTVVRTGYHGKIPSVTVDGEVFEGDPRQPHPCTPGPGQLWDVRGALVGGRPVSSEPVDVSNFLPDNVASRLEKGDVLLLNFHMINPRQSPIDACFKINLHNIPDGDVEFEAGRFVLYNLHVTVPPSSAASARMACPVLSEATLLTAVNHMHARGVRARATLWDDKPSVAGAVPLMELYDQTEWAEPLPAVFDEPVTLEPGQWIDWSCDYVNMEDRQVSQGTATTDEMCAFVGTYYPRNRAMEQCGDPDTGERLLGGIVLADGELDGQSFLDCFLSSPLTFTGNGDDPDRYQSQSCFTNTCASVSPLTQPFLRCLGVEGTLEACEDLRAALAEAECD